MEQLTNPDQLQMFFKANDRIKFSVKVFYVLQFVERYPDYKNECGADGKHFISNSTLLGNTLSIKPNTINTNFRSHGFKIIPYKAIELSTDFPNLSDIRNWKKRINQKYNFNHLSLIDEINNIPCQPIPGLKTQKNYIFNQNSLTLPLNLSYPTPQLNTINNNNPSISLFKQIPNETQILLSNDQETLLNTLFITNKISHNIQKSQSLLLYATRDWIQVVGMESKTDPNIIIDAIMSNYQGECDLIRLRSNISYLLLFQMESTQQQEDGLMFSQFFDFFLRYGTIKNAAKNVSDLTQMKIERVHQIEQSQDIFSCFQSQEQEINNNASDSQSSMSFLQSCFCSWFQPSLNASVAKKLLENQHQNAWLLRPSSRPSKFTIHYKGGASKSSSSYATYIDFNPLCGNDETAFTVLTDRKTVVGANSLHEILFEMMGFDEKNCVSLDAKVADFYQDSPLFVEISSSQRLF